MVPVKSTEKASPQLSKCSKASSKYLRGFEAEALVKDHFLAKDYKFLFQRQRISKIEVDLAFESGGVLHLIEVKSVRSQYYSYISAQQMRRLRRVALILSKKQRKPLRFHLALVINTEIKLIWDFLRH